MKRCGWNLNAYNQVKEHNRKGWVHIVWLELHDILEKAKNYRGSKKISGWQGLGEGVVHRQVQSIFRAPKMLCMIL